VPDRTLFSPAFDGRDVLEQVLAQAGGVPPLSVESQVIFLIIAVALVLFVWEPVPIDVVAIAVLVTLVALEPVFGNASVAR
jgi:hypothetical protein